ncbi:MAG: DUF4040 domain-containing protein [Candidatus Thiothrix putei]|uniref:DUF4040 domain-containing protein n=1 Tax=Candidatus Thiothrix putei TaxID=3080811 RepID=A0AA95HDV0_9GAMM|nr:MAG: DUF4040 domain-containing protein [Candidatus Thiothrix putei]
MNLLDGLWGILDLLLVAVLLLLAMAAVLSSDRRRSMMLFIVFGLVLALVWARLHAPDIALAEAAIGAGLGGALLMATLRRDTHQQTDQFPQHATVLWGAGVLVMVLGTMIAWGLFSVLPTVEQTWRKGAAVDAQLAFSGISHPVTAVLLNFRAWDTLLELAVLLAAILGIRALGYVRAAYVTEAAFSQLAVWLVPLLILMAGYVLWAGAHSPGGAFQAGALLAGAGILLRLAGYSHAGLPTTRWLVRLGLVAGTGVFLLVGLALLGWGQGFLHYPVAYAKWWILLIEMLATVSIGMTLTLAFMGGIPEKEAA